MYIYLHTIFTHTKAILIYTQGLKYMPASAAEFIAMKKPSTYDIMILIPFYLCLHSFLLNNSFPNI